MSDINYIPILQIRSNGLLNYWESDHSARFGLRSKGWQVEHEKYTGLMNNTNRNKLKRAVMILCASAKNKTAWNFKIKKDYQFKVNFITLTLPAAQEQTTDRKILEDCFQPFLKRVARRWGNVSYVWRAEKQENGNLHFHLTTDTWIALRWIRNNWNSLLTRTPLIEEFYKKHNHRNPNSTDVHAVWKVRDLPAYISKYMSKQSQEQKKVEIKIWGCSENLKNAKWPAEILEGEYELLYNRALKLFPENVKEGDHFSFIWLQHFALNRLVKGKVLERWEEWKKSIIPDREKTEAYPFYDKYLST